MYFFFSSFRFALLLIISPSSLRGNIQKKITYCWRCTQAKVYPFSVSSSASCQDLLNSNGYGKVPGTLIVFSNNKKKRKENKRILYLLIDNFYLWPCINVEENDDDDVDGENDLRIFYNPDNIEMSDWTKLFISFFFRVSYKCGCVCACDGESGNIISIYLHILCINYLMWSI